MRRRIGAIIALFSLLSACGSAEPPGGRRTLTSLGIQAPALMLQVRGQTVQLVARAYYSDGAEDVTQKAVWSSSNPGVATVSASGLVTAVDDGTTEVSAAYEGRTASALLVVRLLPDDPDWVSLGAVEADGVTDVGVHDIAVDSRDDQVLYVAANRGLFVSRNGGASWTRCYSTPEGNNPGVLAQDPNNPDHILYGVRQTLLMSQDGGITWQNLKQFNSGIRSVEISRLDSHTIYAGLQGPSNDGIWRSMDDGVSWEAHSFGYATRGITQIIPWEIAEDPIDGTLYVPTELHDHPQPYRPPAFRSLDRGFTWENITGSLPWHGVKVVVRPDTEEVLFLTEGAGIYRSTDHGLSWSRHGAASFALDLIEDGNNLSRFFGGDMYYKARPGGVYVSTDGALTFAPFGLHGRTCGGLALSADSARLFAACYNSGIWVKQLSR